MVLTDVVDRAREDEDDSESAATVCMLGDQSTLYAPSRSRATHAPTCSPKNQMPRKVCRTPRTAARCGERSEHEWAS